MKKNQMVINTLFAVICAIFLNTASFAEPTNLSHLKEKIQAYHDSGAYLKELAIVLDIDETSLSNYDKIVSRGFAANHEQLHQEILAADAPAIKPTLLFYDDVLKHGVTVFFVTGRIESERKATAKNLKYAGYHDWAGLYLKPENYHQPSITPFKLQSRTAITKQGYTIIASIGDQYSDLKGGYAEKTYKLPNPYYYLP